jgi:MAP/microtubule affinity-regulating kinase
MPPEITLKLKYDGKAADIWAAGVLFVCLLQGSFPFRAQNEKELFRKIRNGDMKLETKDSDLLRVIHCMLAIDPRKRATAKEVPLIILYREKLLSNEIF